MFEGLAGLAFTVDFLSRGGRRYRKLLVAPTNLRHGITQLIEREGVVGGRIIIKVNNLIDPEIIEALYSAAQRGAQIDLIVRSMSALRPGVPETEVAAEMEYAARRSGAVGMAFESIVAAGTRSALPHGRAARHPTDSPAPARAR